MQPGSLFEGTLSAERLELMRVNGWTVEDYFDEGQCVASALVKGPEIHITIAPEWRGHAMSRRRVRDFLARHLERRGYLTTRVLHEKKEAQALIARVGFKKTWEDAMFAYFELTKLPFERKAK